MYFLSLFPSFPCSSMGTNLSTGLLKGNRTFEFYFYFLKNANKIKDLPQRLLKSFLFLYTVFAIPSCFTVKLIIFYSIAVLKLSDFACMDMTGKDAVAYCSKCAFWPVVLGDSPWHSF